MTKTDGDQYYADSDDLLEEEEEEARSLQYEMQEINPVQTEGGGWEKVSIVCSTITVLGILPANVFIGYSIGKR